MVGGAAFESGGLLPLGSKGRLSRISRDQDRPPHRLKRCLLSSGFPILTGLLGGTGKPNSPVLHRGDHVERDVVMLAAGARILAGQLNSLVVQMVHSPNMLVVRADHIHVLL